MKGGLSGRRKGSVIPDDDLEPRKGTNSIGNGKYEPKHKGIFVPYEVSLKETWLLKKIKTMYCGSYNICTRKA